MPEKSGFVCQLNQSHNSEEQNALLTPVSGQQCLVHILKVLVCEKEIFVPILFTFTRLSVWNSKGLICCSSRFLDHPSRCGNKYFLCLFFKDLFRCSRLYIDIFMYIFSINYSSRQVGYLIHYWFTYIKDSRTKMSLCRCGSWLSTHFAC